MWMKGQDKNVAIKTLKKYHQSFKVDLAVKRTNITSRILVACCSLLLLLHIVAMVYYMFSRKQGQNDISVDQPTTVMIDTIPYSGNEINLELYVRCLKHLSGTGYIERNRELINRKLKVMQSKLSLMNEQRNKMCPPPAFVDNKWHIRSIDREESVIRQLKSRNSDGSWGSSGDCTGRQRILIVVPYRNREHQLMTFLYYLHQHLIDQDVVYKVYIVEQLGDGPFNKGSVMNAAYEFGLSDWIFDCIIFHDVDLIPEDRRNVYRCLHEPVHFSVEVNTMNYQLFYATLIGGVLGFTPGQFLKVNGFSNIHYNWGGEDDDMYERIKSRAMRILRPHPPSLGRYTMLAHNRSVRATVHFQNQFREIKEYRMSLDGIVSPLTTIVAVKEYPHHLHIYVQLPEPQNAIHAFRYCTGLK